MGEVALLPAVIEAKAEVAVGVFVAQAQVVSPARGVEAVLQAVGAFGAVEAGVGGVGAGQVAAGQLVAQAQRAAVVVDLASGVSPEAVAGLGSAHVQGGGHGVQVGPGRQGRAGGRGGHVGFHLGNEVAVGVVVKIHVEHQPATWPESRLVAYLKRADVLGLEVSVRVAREPVLVLGHGLQALLGRRGRGSISINSRRYGRIKSINAGAQVAALEHAVRHHPQPADALHLPAVHVAEALE